MNVLVGLALFALALLAPSVMPVGRVWSLAVVGVLQGGARYALAMGGVYYALGRSARGSALAGVVGGGLFALLMGILIAGAFGYMFFFRRSSWVFGKAWSEAGLSTKPVRFGGIGFRRFHEAQARVQLARELRREWEQRADKDQTAKDFLGEHKAEIEASLKKPR